MSVLRAEEVGQHSHRRCPRRAQVFVGLERGGCAARAVRWIRVMPLPRTDRGGFSPEVLTSQRQTVPIPALKGFDEAARVRAVRMYLDRL